MKRHLLAILFALSLTSLSAQIVGNTAYIWFTYPRYTSAGRSIEYSIDGKHVGHVALHDLLEVKLGRAKSYDINFFDKGDKVASLHIDSLRDSISYHMFDLTASNDKKLVGHIEPKDKLTGGLYVMQRNNYSYVHVAYEEGIDDVVIADGKIIPPDRNSYGTGFLVSADGYIVTNYHVVDGAQKYKIKGVEGDFTTEYEADIVAKDVNNDLVLLQLKNKTVHFSTPPYTLHTSAASTGEDIFILGYPLGPLLGDEIKLTTGVISAKSGVAGNVSSYQISAAAQPGNSGGPLFDSDGNVLGVVNAKIKNAENITYAIKSVYLQALLGMLPVEPHLQAAGTLKDKKLPEKVTALSKFIYIIKCE